jgi:hypothetical protein
MLYAAAAVERAMKIQQVIVRALSGAITWLQAADILGVDPRALQAGTSATSPLRSAGARGDVVL